MFRFLLSKDGRAWVGLRLQKRDSILNYLQNYEDVIAINTKRKTINKSKLINIAWETGIKSQSGFDRDIGDRELMYDFYHTEMSQLNQKQIFRKIWKSLAREKLIYNE